MERRRCDRGRLWQMGRQEPSTPVGEGIRLFHSDRLGVLGMVTRAVAWILVRVVRRFEGRGKPSLRVHGTVLEVVWTLRPALRLAGIAVPSFTLLYALEEMVAPGLSVKIMGHQWYWTYEYGGEIAVGPYESYMRGEDDLGDGERRRLSVDKRRMRPLDTQRRRIVTAGDVLHSWAVPSFGVKIDACPGRLNQVARYVTRPGTYYGQCSELCGVNHGFMPIVVGVAVVRENLVEGV